MLLLRCIEDPQTHMYQVDWHETTLIHHVTKNHGMRDPTWGPCV